MDVGNINIYEAARKGDFELVKWIVEYSRASLNEFDEKHRTALFYAAISGHLEMFRYLVDRCGLDPLMGDDDLTTPWDIVHSRIKEIEGSKQPCSNEEFLNNLKEIEDYLEKKYGHKYEDYYRNPIRPGFFPDPSICRVGSDYYMVNSSFIFFPCIPISHSKDLVHWEIIGHAITNPKWALLDELEGGRGYWAPDITYYNGKFYIAATYRLNDSGPVYRRQIVVSSDKPEGPYSEPVFIDEDGIDPGLFNDDDGRRYMLLNRGARIFELDDTGTKKISDARLLYYGSNKRAPEGPHIYKKNGYYYLLQAEGGTGLGHRVTVARSRELFGVYEPCPYNPIMRQNDEEAAIQRCGHGDLVETPDGRWFMVYLCGRQIGNGYSILGRETALDPVTWTADGWPIVNNLKGPSCMQVKPFADADFTNQGKIESENTGKDTISPCGLPMDYMTPRGFYPGDVSFKGNKFYIRGSKAPLSSVDSRNIVLRRQDSFKFKYSAILKPLDLKEGQSAGITGYYDENTYLEFGIVKKDGMLYIYSNEHIGEDDNIFYGEKALKAEFCGIELVMTTDMLVRTLSYRLLPSSELTTFNTLSDVYYLCDEGYHIGKRFTGALVGMYAYGGKESLTAVFEFPLYVSL
ncbi:family 43 glycosylhydrolase [Butyrivibrio sp. INlla14]|uniref:family 43 glycosylhydrolase n=1 Tax=Butyrivibrio sp. INlla14 TaxID=1520808 RepID=UPI000876430A|nr:family 43 glycosylhydrolase [Butyrivibrio sp. INlla14]SCX81859.1 xylan 1,4-beta-xylosidase [Butyrivibrio sp. INlla14]